MAPRTISPGDVTEHMSINLPRKTKGAVRATAVAERKSKSAVVVEAVEKDPRIVAQKEKADAEATD